MSIFNLGLKKHQEIAAESYYQLEPEEELTEEDIKILEALEKLNASKAETNKAFNETDKNKQFAEAYKPIAPPEDYLPQSHDALAQEETFTKDFKDKYDAKLDTQELSSFNKVNELLKKQQNEGANTKSTISFSLVDRKKVHIPIPIYLCEMGGKIVVNITVNTNGNVVDAYVNSSSSTSNQCLTEHALEYAKEARFNPDASKKSQIGSITFHFIGKR